MITAKKEPTAKRTKKKRASGAGFKPMGVAGDRLFSLPAARARTILSLLLGRSDIQLIFAAKSTKAEQLLRLYKGKRIRGGRVAATRHPGTEGADAEIDRNAYEPGPRARALLRGREIMERDLREAGGTFDLEHAQEMLNYVSRQAIEKRVREGSLLAVPGPNNRRRYPVFQFSPPGVLPGLKEVTEALPTSDPWAVLNFFVHPDSRLDGRRPMDVLQGGDVDLVVSAARSLGEQGA